MVRLVEYGESERQHLLDLPCPHYELTPLGGRGAPGGGQGGAVQAEVATMQTWYDIARTARNRSTFGVSGLGNEQIAILFADFHGGEIVNREIHGEKLADILRMAAEDLRASYLEAVSAQPGQSTSPNALADWFSGGRPLPPG